MDNFPKVIYETKLIVNEVRETWKGEQLIQRVQALLDIDPGSACQRMFNAAIRDLRDKIRYIGIDIIKVSCEQAKLPRIDNEDAIYEYKVAHIIDLSYHIGLLSRQEYKAMIRSYEIRCDIEHEDYNYNATPEDVNYIFSTCVKAVLSKEPIQLVKLDEVLDILKTDTPVYIDDGLIERFTHTAEIRKKEIISTLIKIALSDKTADIITENIYNALKVLSLTLESSSKIDLGFEFNSSIKTLTSKSSRILHSSGIFAYTDILKRKAYFNDLIKEIYKNGIKWEDYPRHRTVLKIFEEIGYLKYCPKEILRDIMKPLIMIYIGVPGRTGYFGRNRDVFYSDTAAPYIAEIFNETGAILLDSFVSLARDKDIELLTKNPAISKRFEYLFGLIDTK